MEYVRLMATQGHHSLVLSEPVHANGTVETFSEEQLAEWYPLESPIVASPSQLPPVQSTQSNEADQTDSEVDSERDQGPEAKDSEVVKQ